MSNIGKKVRIKNYTGEVQEQYNGQIGEIVGEGFESMFAVKLSSGHTIIPFRPNRVTPQCEFLEEYAVEDIVGKKFAIHVPTIEISNKVIQILEAKNYIKGGLDYNKEWHTYQEETCWFTDLPQVSKERKSHAIGVHKKVIKGEDFIIHNEHLLITKKEETMSTENPKNFLIVGKTHHIAAIKQDLKALGYNFAVPFNEGLATAIGNNKNRDCTKREDYTELYADLSSSSFSSHPAKFNLPEQYSEALAFAKEQINHPYWTKKPESKEMNIGSKNTPISIKKDGTIFFSAEGARHNTNIGIVKQLTQYSKSSQNIAGYSVAIDHTCRFIRIGCERENNLFSINEIQSIVDTYNELNS